MLAEQLKFILLDSTKLIIKLCVQFLFVKVFAFARSESLENIHGRLKHSKYEWTILQGSVTEDKSSSSHIVVPIPGSLEDGEASNVFILY